MYKPVAQRIAVAWIALLGILFAALWPTMSHALISAVPTAEEVQVCTAGGMVTIAVDERAMDKPGPTPERVLKHCPYCVAHGASPVLLPTHAFVLPILSDRTSRPSLFYRSAAPLFAWSAANPRAPPALA